MSPVSHPPGPGTLHPDFSFLWSLSANVSLAFGCLSLLEALCPPLSHFSPGGPSLQELVVSYQLLLPSPLEK